MEGKVYFKGGGAFTHNVPVFSSDEENVYVAWKNTILGYSAKTGKLVAEYKGFHDHIVGFSLQNINSFECILACSTVGEIIMWKTVSHFKVFSKKLSHLNKIKKFFVLPSANENKIQCIVAYEKDKCTYFTLVDLDKETSRNYKIKIKKGLYFIDVKSNEYFAVAFKNAIHFVDIFNFEKHYSAVLSGNKHITCLVCHPTEQVVLTGDSQGQVIVWQNIFSTNPTRAVFHWHTLPVQCVAFSVAGSYFYSGGDESVLVRWEFENHLNRKFLPRLPSSIQQIGVSGFNRFLAVATADNAIKIVDSRFNEISLIQHLVIGADYTCGILLDPRTKALVMNGNIGQVQFYSPRDKNLLFSLDIVDQNKITNEREYKMENTKIIQMAINKNGCWLASVEEFNQDNFFESRLKFWVFNMKDQKYKLNTSVSSPHEKSISSILFQNKSEDSDSRCITVSDDKNFKIWQLVQIEMKKEELYWITQSTGYYRDFPCHGLACSVDGSLIAIGFGPIVTTWHPESTELKCSLVYPTHRDQVKSVIFGNNNLCYLLVSATCSNLSVWNLLTLTMSWTVPLNVQFLLADSLTSHMAAITYDKAVFVFSPDSPEPEYANEEILKNHNILTAALIPSQYFSDKSKWYNKTQLYFIDSSKELHCLGSEEEVLNGVDAEPEDEGFNLLGSLIPNQKVSTGKSITPTQHMFKKDITHKNIRKYLDAPLQTMAPIRLTCASLIRSLVIQKDASAIS